MRKLLLYTLLFVSSFAYSQKAIIASGGSSSGNGTVSYSVGQTVYTSITSNNSSVSQGIQQGFEFYPLSNLNFKALTLEAITYPNPTQDKINLVLKNTDLKELSYRLFDVKGLEISKGKVIQNSTPISLTKMAAGIYILKVNHQNKQLKSFKIIKK